MSSDIGKVLNRHASGAAPGDVLTPTAAPPPALRPLCSGPEFHIVSCRFLGLWPTEGMMPLITRAFGFSSGLSFLTAAQLLLATNATAQQYPAAFYRGRTIQAVVGYTPGSTFELYLRTVSRHLGRHVPGTPNIVVQHMPGAGSLKVTAYLAQVAPKDGSVIGMPNPVNTTEPLID